MATILYLHIHHSLAADFSQENRRPNKKKAKFLGLLSGSAAPTLTANKKLHDLDAENVI